MGYYSRRRGGSRVNHTKTPVDRPDIARRIAGIMAQQRRGLEAPEFGKRGGRVDRRRLSSIATGNDRVFATRSGRSSTRLKVVVIVDLSGSMVGENAQRAIQTAWDFALAIRQVPSASLEIWAHSTGYLNIDEKPLPDLDDPAESSTGVREGHYVVAYHLYEEGMTARQFYQQFKDIRMSGNEDGWSLDAVLSDVSRRTTSNERMLAIMVSDGAPAYAEQKAGIGHVKAVVNRWRKRGAGVVSVSVDAHLRKEAQNNMYGHEWVVPFTEDPGRNYWDPPQVGLSRINVTHLGRVIGRALA
jgi:hypothetical protein